MPSTFADLFELLRRAAGPQDVFGPLGADAQAALKRRYRELVTIAHPDHNPDCVAEATDAFTRLRDWYAVAQRQVQRGVYGAAPQISATTKLHHYTGYEPPLHGDLCDLFPAEADGERVLLKVARQPRNNDLLAAEAQALRQIERALAGQAVRAHFPTLVEHFLLRDATGVRRHANVLRAESGFVSLAEVLLAYPRGIPAHDAAWMFNRLLAALGTAHGLGLVHGAVTPAHVLIRPADHNGMLVDWCYSVPIGEPLKALSPPYAADYPPEVATKQPATPANDLYMAARCLVRLLGGDGDAQSLPAGVPKPIRALLRGCLLAAPQRRAGDAWQLFDDFHEILGRLYGPPVFRPFQMPSPVTR
ncbi:MAG: molecular chaperone DnaJ [Roseiflexaceae bacterium]